MIIDDLIRLSLKEIWYHKIQSLLIIGSVALGIFAIFTLNSLGTGIKEELFDVMGQMGADVAYVFPTTQGMMGAGGSFNDEDMRTIESVPGIEMVCKMVFGMEAIKGKTAYVAGMSDECYDWIEDIGLYKYVRGTRGVAMGYVLWNDLELEVGDKIEIQDKEFRITGLMESVGNEQDDSSVYFSLENAQEIYGKDEYYLAYVRFSGDPETFSKNLENKFRNKKNVQIMTNDQMLSQIGGIFDTLNVAVLGVAFISLIVGAITIANTTYAIIKRRTREIGMYKAVGARDQDILIMFLSESMIMSFLGGIVGIISGYIVASIIAMMIERYVAFTPSTNPYLIGGSLLIAMLVGPIAALIPSIYASKLPPTEALRYE